MAETALRGKNHMHELGLCDAIVKMMDGILEEEKMEGANKIVLEIGELSGVEAHFMEDGWTAVTAQTRYEDTRLQIEMVPGIARCMDCGRECRAAACDLKCPECGSVKLVPVSGTGMTIREIEAY